MSKLYRNGMTAEQLKAEDERIELVKRAIFSKIDEENEARRIHQLGYWAIVIAVIVIIGAVVFSMAHAEEIDIDRLANAIYYAEGGTKTAHPYGILAHYKHTTPRQACINTINHALRDWNGKGDFVSFLGARYCPVGAKNDPTGLNRNWVKNVKRIYAKGQ